MKYLVNRETKEHLVADEQTIALMTHQQHSSDFYLADADADGWIIWSGEDCPLPAGCKCEIKSAGDLGSNFPRKAELWNF